MRKIAVKLKHKDGAYKLGNDFILCRVVLRRLFTLPKAHKTPISVTISGEQIPNSYKVKFGNRNCEVFYEGFWNSETLYGDADDFVHRNNLRGKTVWVSIHWEE